MYKQNKSSIHPALKLIILLVVYSLGYISGSINQKQSKIETISNDSYDKIGETNIFDNEPKTSEYNIPYDISYSDLNENEKKLYDKVLSTAMNKDNTFITNKELSFSLNATLSENEASRVQIVLSNNYPDIIFYTNRYIDSWMYYETKYLNGLPIHRTYYFNVKYN